MKHWGKLLFGLLVTVVALWWALREVTFSDVWQHIRQADPWLLLLCVFVGTFGFVFRAMRWRILLHPVRPSTRFRSRMSAVSIGFMANNVLPARVGEFARAYAFSRVEPVTASAAFGTLVIERFMDGVVLLLFFVVPVFTPGFPTTGALSSGLGATLLRGGVALVLVVLAALIVMAVWPRRFVRVAEHVAGYLPETIERPIVSGLEAFLDSIAIIRDPKLLIIGFAWSFFFWAWHAASFWLGMLAFGIGTGYVSAMFVVAVVGFGVAAPAAPGFVGTFHAAAKFALSDVFGVSDGSSLAFAFGYHFGNWIPITAIGLWYAWRLGFSLGEVGTAEERVEEEVEAEHPEALASSEDG